MTPAGSASPVGLFGLHSQTTLRPARGRADRVEVEGLAFGGRSAPRTVTTSHRAVR